MKEMRIYKNYGCLAAEKRVIYTQSAPAATATCYDEITVKIPEDFEAYENMMGEIMVETPWGITYNANELLGGNEKPMFKAIDFDGKEHRVALEVI
jgi:hypothetical protein